MAWAAEASEAASVRMTTDAEAGCLPRRNEPDLGQHEVHARRLDALHRLDRARKLALEGPRARHLLHERREADGTELVEQLVARVRARRQPLLGEQHAGARGLLARHHHLRALGVDVEPDALFEQRRADAAHVLGVEAGVERLHVGAAQIIAAEPDRDEHSRADDAERRQPPRAQRQKIAPKLLNLLEPKHRLSGPFRGSARTSALVLWESKLARELRARPARATLRARWRDGVSRQPPWKRARICWAD